jgi:hypothetical protein
MRVLPLLVALTIFVPAATSAADAQKSQAPKGAHCPQTTSYLADKTGVYRSQRLTPRKLTELPPATTYMAVYRHIDRCEVPMTMSEYRTHRR